MVWQKPRLPDRKGETLIKVKDGQNPYSVIGKYIREHITVIEDMIAVIEIDGHITNELFMVDMDEDGFFVWKSDWWEGEKNVSLMDFFPVSDAEKPSAQPEPVRINLNESIKVKLTDWGREIYYHQYDSINRAAGREICKPKFPKEDENGYTEFQLWCFIELYGMHMGMTLPNVIDPLEIVYEK